MTIGEFVNNIGNMSINDRAVAGRKLYSLLSPMSRKTLLLFQAGWDMGRTFPEFVEKQNELIRICVEMEISNLGFTIRNMMGLEPLFLDTLLGPLPEPATDATAPEKGENNA